jgi:hypothetical protein
LELRIFIGRHHGVASERDDGIFVAKIPGASK